MPRQLREPTLDELPSGQRRDFALYLYGLWRAARRPDLRTVADAVRDGQYDGSTSREQVRRMLRGQTVPTRWENLEAVFEVLCDRGGVDPDGEDPSSPSYQTRRDHLLRLWNSASDAPPPAKPASHPAEPARPPLGSISGSWPMGTDRQLAHGAHESEHPGHDEGVDEGSQPAQTWVSVPPLLTSPESPLAGHGGLTVNVDNVEGAAGSIYQDLVFTNTGARRCVLNGYPRVEFMAADGTSAVGSSARPDGPHGGNIVLEPGDVAHATLRIGRTENYEETNCGPVPVSGLRITAPAADAEPVVIRSPVSTACSLSTGSLMSVGAVRAAP